MSKATYGGNGLLFGAQGSIGIRILHHHGREAKKQADMETLDRNRPQTGSRESELGKGEGLKIQSLPPSDVLPSASHTS